MKVALIGYGKMGQLIAAQARAAGHDIGLTLNSGNTPPVIEDLSSLIAGHDAAIDFSVGDSVLSHVEACARAGVPLVEGTTGWNTHLDEAKRIIREHDAALVFGANFSIGVNIHYRLVEKAAALFQAFKEYDVFIEEAHHARKKDAPSGTALRIKEIVNRFTERDVSIASTRAGHIPGTHTVGFDSAADQITLTHTARNRDGFAAGALTAARWIVGRKGVYEFSEVVDEMLKTPVR